MKQKIKIVIVFILSYTYIIINSHIYSYKNKLIEKISKIYNRYYKVNINEIDNEISGKKDNFEKKENSIINIGFTLDKDNVLDTMITVSSIMASQYKTTKIRFHFGVTNNFTA